MKIKRKQLVEIRKAVDAAFWARDAKGQFRIPGHTDTSTALLVALDIFDEVLDNG